MDSKSRLRLMWNSNSEQSGKYKQYLKDHAEKFGFNSENFSNFTLHLAAMYKGETQRYIQGKFNELFDLIQGARESTLSGEPDNTPRTFAQAIKEALNIEYNGQSGSNVLAGNITPSTEGRRDSKEAHRRGERAESGNESSNDSGGTESGSRQGEINPVAQEFTKENNH